MGMLQKKGTLERKPNPVIKNQVDREVPNLDKMLLKTANSAQLGVRSQTERATVKVDNHVRNALTALVDIGLYESQKDAVEKMCQRIVENLSVDERKRFDLILDSLELKDYMKQQGSL